MGDRKLFRIGSDSVTELSPSHARFERGIQTLFEQHLEQLLGIRFLVTEYATGANHGGRIDTLGLDENNYPVIIEYKRQTNENILSQVLFYFDWLINNKPEFQLLVQRRLGADLANAIDWDGIRLVCIAGDYAKYDLHAVRHVNKNIEFVTYRHYGDLLLLDYVAGENGLKTGLQKSANMASNSLASASDSDGDPYHQQSMEYRLSKADSRVRELFSAVDVRLRVLGDDVNLVKKKQYYAYKRIKNFACVEVYPSKGVTLFLRLSPSNYSMEPNFTRDVREIGHYGTGDLEVIIRSEEDIEKAIPLFQAAYDNG